MPFRNAVRRGAEATPVLADKSIRVALRSWLARVVQLARDGQGARLTPLGGSGHPLPQALMRSRGVDVRGVLPEDAAQVGLAQDAHMSQTLAPHAPREAPAPGVLPGRAVRRAHLLDAGRRSDAGDVLAVWLADKSIRIPSTPLGALSPQWIGFPIAMADGGAYPCADGLISQGNRVHGCEVHYR